jgi:hypothetical protein
VAWLGCNVRCTTLVRGVNVLHLAPASDRDTRFWHYGSIFRRTHSLWVREVVTRDKRLLLEAPFAPAKITMLAQNRSKLEQEQDLVQFGLGALPERCQFGREYSQR